MGDILVIGLSGRDATNDLSALLHGRVVMARCGERAAARIPGDRGPVVRFDELFHRPDPRGVDEEIAEALIRQSASSDVAYLVSGPASVGDLTVQTLARRAAIRVLPGLLTAKQVASSCLVVDALELAQATAAAPFDAGLASLDATIGAVITNWYGEVVQRLAATRLREVYRVGEIPDPDDDGFVVIPAHDASSAPPSIAALQAIVARLRRPDGCPWDREQTPDSMLEDLREEVEELDLAIGRKDDDNTLEELGDVLLHVLMQAQMASELGTFRFEDVVAAINAKLVRRHPHVFGDIQATSPADVLSLWQQIKQREKDAASPALGR